VNSARAALAALVLLLGAAATSSCGSEGAHSAAEERSVAILSPTSGAEVDVGSEVPVDVVAHDSRGIVRLELWVDGVMVDSAPSPSGEPVQRMQASLFWTPVEPTQSDVTIRAYDWQDTVLGTASHVVNATSTP
jgi:hypothetical protein